MEIFKNTLCRKILTLMAILGANSLKLAFVRIHLLRYPEEGTVWSLSDLLSVKLTLEVVRLGIEIEDPVVLCRGDVGGLVSGSIP